MRCSTTQNVSTSAAAYCRQSSSRSRRKSNERLSYPTELGAIHDESCGLALVGADDTKEISRAAAGANGLDPRLAQMRVILFFWPIGASSWNQIYAASMNLPCGLDGT